MTSDDAVYIAAATAARLNMPWGPVVRATRLWRLWPLARRWRVVSRVPEELAETTIVVNERTREGTPVRVRHAPELGGPTS